MHLLITVGTVPVSFAYNYGEHKEIGDEAFNRFAKWLVTEQNMDSVEVRRLFRIWFKMRWDDTAGSFIYPSMTFGDDYATYGVLNGLSADHEENPLILEEQLHYKSSITHQIIDLHNQYIEMGYTTAPNVTVASHDIRYALFAALDLSHFHSYGVPYHKQIKQYDKDAYENIINPSYVNQLFKKVLSKTNSIDKYIFLHTVAIYLAEMAGKSADSSPEEAHSLMYYALLFNSFADHFLQDNFSGGHFVVNRSVFNSIVNNQALHDFYNQRGLEVVNLKGEIWVQHGDNQFNRKFSSWKKKQKLTDISYASYTQTAERIITATQLSLQEVWFAFAQSREDTQHPYIIDRMPEDEDELARFYLRSFQVLSIQPVPINSDWSFFEDLPDNKEELEKTNQLLSYRNFVRNRIANSIVVGLGGRAFTTRTNSFIDRIEVRFNAGAFIKAYDYASYGSKKGSIDNWLGTTISYSRDLETAEFAYFNALKAGLNFKFDWWAGNKRFLGIFTYQDIGVKWNNQNSYFVYSPTVGVGLGSLVGINYYNMPTWMRLPIQFLLPLKFRWTVDIANGTVPVHYLMVELDVLF